jgi:hypothetical protein
MTVCRYVCGVLDGLSKALATALADLLTPAPDRVK